MKKLAATLFVLSGLIFTSTALASQPEDLHCPTGGDKTETSDGSIVLEAGTIFCVKQSNGNTGQLVADGVTNLGDYAEAAGFPNGVSYYVVYGTSTPAPSDTPNPTVTPEPTPTPTPEVTPTPTPEITPTPTPTPSASNSPTPTPEVTPTPTPEPTPEPSPTITPRPEPSSIIPEATPRMTLPPTDTES